MPIKPIDRTTLLNITIIVEACLLSAATVWTWLASIQLAPALEIKAQYLAIGGGAGFALAAGSLILMWLGKNLVFLSQLREVIISQIAPLFAELNWLDACFVAVISGFCEEILFRGVVQAQCGLLSTAAVFGIFHCPSLKHLSYGIWAFAAGLLLGWLYIVTGNLWVPIAAHVTSNAISLIFLRYAVKPAAS